MNLVAASRWAKLPLRPNSYGAAEPQAGSYVGQRIALSKQTPNGVYKFVVDQQAKVWLSPMEADMPHSALVPRGQQVRGAGVLGIKNGRVNVNGRSGHYMAERPIRGSQVLPYDRAIRGTFADHGVEVVDHNVGVGGGAIRPPQ
jgi:hypothetical protein